jgi:lipopolysaccharide export system protein LptA
MDCLLRIARRKMDAVKRNPVAKRTWSTCVMVLLAAVFWCEPLRAQGPSLGTVKGFNVSEYFGAPYHRQMKVQITGAEAQRLEGGKQMLVKGMKLQRFKETGETQIIVEAPECLYENGKHDASSPGHLRLRTGDGRLVLEGDGFLWQERESVLTISNNIHSELYRPETNSPPGQARVPLVITSDWFRFNVTNLTGVFHERVKGDDPQTSFSAGTLTVSASTNGQSFERLLAEGKASIINKTNGSSASARQIIYTRESEVVQLIDNAAWKEGLREGKGDYWMLSQRDKSFSGDGHLAMKLPRESIGVGGFFDTPTNAPTKTATTNDALVDIFANHFDSKSNLALVIAKGEVRVVDGTNQLACDTLTMRSTKGAPSNDTAIAEGSVVVTGEAGHRVRGPKAVYTKSDGLVVFTGRPEWNLDQSEGSADRMTMNRDTREVHGQGNVKAKVMVGAQQGSVLKLFPDSGDTNQPPRIIEVFANDLLSKEHLVTLTGNARAHQSPITGSEPRLQSDVMDVRFGTNVHSVEVIQARKNVVYEEGTPGVTNGPAAYRKMVTSTLTAHTDPTNGALSTLLAQGGVTIDQFNNLAKGERATYTAATDSFELTGNPTLETPKSIITQADKLIWDKVNQQFVGTGPLKMELKVKPTQGDLGLPKKK